MRRFGRVLGISANPAIGHTADLLAVLGGRTILSEFPELCGVEQELINRSKSKVVGDRFIQLMRDYSARAVAARSGFDMNPSPVAMQSDPAGNAFPYSNPRGLDDIRGNAVGGADAQSLAAGLD